MALIRFFKPTLKRKDMDAVLQTMVDEKIGPGERRREFVRLFSAYTGFKDGVSLRSYVDAIRIALISAGCTNGTKIITSVLSPEIYKYVVKEAGAELMLCDINPDTGCISLEAVNKAMAEGASILLLHEPICQLPTDLGPLKDSGLFIIEDITQSVGSRNTPSEEEKREIGSYPGSLGSILICAFEEDGVISTGGGSVVLGSKDGVVEQIKSAVKPYSSYIEMPDMNAALGIIQLANLSDLLRRRAELYKLFSSALMKSEHKLFGGKGIDFVPNGYAFPVLLNGRPDETITFANKYGVSCKRSFTKCVGSGFQDRFDLYPNAVPALSRGVSFPLYPFLQAKDTEAIMKVLSHLP